ncbi:MAG TPA: hypothetical protein VFE31_09685 [Opitutaceae bacterium]|nr:hypothetical protein [Opitutaceae bacterium]
MREDEIDGGSTVSAFGAGIHTGGDMLEQLRANGNATIDRYMDETMDAPKVIRLHFVRDEARA